MQTSVFTAGPASTTEPPELLVIHDAVRPLVDELLLAHLLSAANEFGVFIDCYFLIDFVLNTAC